MEALTERGRRLRERTAEDERQLENAVAAGVPRMHVIEAEYALSLARAETAWVDSVIEELRSGALAWPTGPRVRGRRTRDVAAPVVRCVSGWGHR
ncbi:hypothetical protein ACFQV4_20765 [Streptomyces thermocarboxydus]